jgi:hypothetical protein
MSSRVLLSGRVAWAARAGPVSGGSLGEVEGEVEGEWQPKLSDPSPGPDRLVYRDSCSLTYLIFTRPL